jgi:hypothetical protein
MNTMTARVDPAQRAARGFCLGGVSQLDQRRPFKRQEPGFSFFSYGLVAWLLTITLLASAGAWPRYSSSMPLELRIPSAHPCPALTPELIERARQRAATSPMAKEQMDRVLAQASGLLAKPWGQLPARANEEHRAICGRLFTAGLAYALSGGKMNIKRTFRRVTWTCQKNGTTPTASSGGRAGT